MSHEQKKCSLLVGAGKERRLALPASYIYDHYRHICGLCQQGNFLFRNTFPCKGLVILPVPLVVYLIYGLLYESYARGIPFFDVVRGYHCRHLGKGIPSGVCTEACNAGLSLVYICCKCKFVVARVVGRGF